ncbi:MAG TPA: esterase-like activity of phytase family protein [Candidatus Binatia bacterium]|nr:esterase-like activity of phytase family protein [Candidatus Binatia bacterium]
MKSSQSFALLLAGFLIALLIACSKHSSSSAAGDFHVELQPIAVDVEKPERVEFGRLKLVGAFHLRSSDSRFGGLSGLTIGKDGRLYAVSDRGFWLSARMHLDRNGRLLNLTDWQFATLLTTTKRPVTNLFTDAEGLAQAPDGSFLVSFEQSHRIWRYPASPEPFSSPAIPVPLRAEMVAAPTNGGFEAISALPDGRIFTISEEHENDDGSFKAWLLNDNHWSELSYQAQAGFNPSDAVALANGDVLVLERRHNLPLRFSARLTLIRAKDIRPGGSLRGEEVMRLEPPLMADNFEGIAVKEIDEGTMIFLASDDNYFVLQRSLLLQFLLPNSGQAAH